MKTKLKKIIRILIGHESTTLDEQRCEIDPSVIRLGIRTRFDNPVDGRKYLRIGKDSIVTSNFFFESEGGHVNIGEHCFINACTFISHCGIDVGNNVTIGWGSTFYDHNSHSLDYLERRKDIDCQLENLRDGRELMEFKDWSTVRTAPIRICDDAWIGINCIILKGVTIGQGAIVGAGSVVRSDVPDWTVVEGNPAKVVKELKRP